MLGACAKQGMESQDVHPPHYNEHSIVGGEIVHLHNDPRARSVVRLKIRFSDTQAGNCTGTVIGKTAIITAAHCVIQQGVRASEVFVFYAGNSSVLGKSKGIKIHPGYLANKSVDLALIQLQDSVPSGVNIAKVAKLSNPLKLDQVLISYGYGHSYAVHRSFLWGYLQWTSKSNNEKLNRAHFQLKASQDAGSLIRHPQAMNKNYFIVEGDQKSMCQGDSGGPTFSTEVEPLLMGVNSAIKDDRCVDNKMNFSADVRSQNEWIETAVKDWLPPAPSTSTPK